MMQGSGSKQQISEDHLLIPAHPRISYLRKLYFLLCIQLYIALVAINVVNSHLEQVNKALKTQQLNLIFIVSAVVTFTCLLVSFFGRQKLQQFPVNWVLYVIYTLSFATCSAYLVCLKQWEDGQMAITFTLLQAITLFAYVLSTKTELTFQGASICIFAGLLVSLQGFCLFSQVPFSHIILASVLSVIWGFYLVYDTQSALSNPYHFEPYLSFSDDSISGAVSVYMDVFILILKMADLLRATIIKHRQQR